MKWLLQILHLCILFACIQAKGQVDSLKQLRFDEIIITAQKSKQIAYSDEKYYIIDFHIDTSKTILLLTNLNKYYVYSLDYNMKKQDALRLNFHPTSLYLDCLGSLHIMSRDSMYQLELINKKLSIFERNSITLYKTFFKHCVAEIGSFVILKTLENENQSTVFTILEKGTRNTKELYRVEDSLLISSAMATKQALQNHEYLIDLRMEEIDTGTLRRSRDQTEKKDFFEQIVKRPTYHPLFVLTDTIYIFDHLNNISHIFDSSTNRIQSKNIHHHKLKNWDEQILMDPNQATFYSVSSTHGAKTLQKLNTLDLTIESNSKITEHAYPKKIIILDGYAYYTYREYVEDNLNKLFKQNLSQNQIDFILDE